MDEQNDQEILVAVGLGHGCVLGYEGKLVFPFITDGDVGNMCWLEADHIFPAKGYPSEPGVYLWRGSISIDWLTDRDYSSSCNGSFMPASVGDIIRLAGKHDPLSFEDQEEPS